MPNLIDITGQRFGRLVVIKQSKTKGKQTCWDCVCDCGKTKTARSDLLRKGWTQSCGCLSSELTRERRLKKIAGQKFGMLTAIKRIPASKSGDGRTRWLCKCDCGKTTKVVTNQLTTGHTKSCGCRKEKMKGLDHPSWKGGRYIDKAGYALVYTPDHPKRNAHNRIMEHRLVMEKEIGRYLESNENVHHKNGIRSDNRIENLELWVKCQPAGQRVNDLIEFSLEILSKYAPDKLAQ